MFQPTTNKITIAVVACKLKLHPMCVNLTCVFSCDQFLSLKVTCIYLLKEAFMTCLADKTFHELMQSTALRTACTRETRWVAVNIWTQDDTP